MTPCHDEVNDRLRAILAEGNIGVARLASFLSAIVDEFGHIDAKAGGAHVDPDDGLAGARGSAVVAATAMADRPS